MQPVTRPVILWDEELQRRREIASEERWNISRQWILVQQFGHLAMITLALSECTTTEAPEPTEAQYLGYFAHLWNDQGLRSSRLWHVYSLLNHSSKRRYGRGLEGTTIRQTLHLYKLEEQQRLPVLSYNGIAYYWNVH